MGRSSGDKQAVNDLPPIKRPAGLPFIAACDAPVTIYR
jgi:hypothetical protein